MVLEGAFDRFLALAIVFFLGWTIYEKRRGNNIIERFTKGNNEKISTGGEMFGIRKH